MPSSRALIVSAEVNSRPTHTMWIDCEIGTIQLLFWHQTLKVVVDNQSANGRNISAPAQGHRGDMVQEPLAPR
jgi:hypothetical protein